MLSFQHTEFLLGLLFYPAFYFIFFGHKMEKKVKKQIGDEELVNALTSDYSQKNFSYKFLLVAAAFALCIIGAAT